MSASGTLVIRAPNHLGDLVAALPAIRATRADVVVRAWLAPLLELADHAGEVIPLARGLPGWRTVVRRLRDGAYQRGVLMTPAFSAALLMRLGGVRRLRGTATDGRGWLLHERVDASALRDVSRFERYHMLADVAPEPQGGGPLLRPTEDLLQRWTRRLSALPRPLVAVAPASHAPARTWPAERFAGAAAAFRAAGRGVVVLGGHAEAGVTRLVAEAADGAVDLGGRTSLKDLATVLSLCDVLLSNDSGTMHLAAAMGTPTVAVWGPSDPGEAWPRGALHLPVVSSVPLPCRPCARNVCPRRGKGTVLRQAHGECMRLIEAEAAVMAVERVLQEAA